MMTADSGFNYSISRGEDVPVCRVNRACGRPGDWCSDHVGGVAAPRAFSPVFSSGNGRNPSGLLEDTGTEPMALSRLDTDTCS